MLNNLQKRKEGFTIVEVMIVLAIAGLIILVVLLAVPALQRNSRNTSIKNDAASVAAAINEFTGSNNGKMPTTMAIADGEVTVSSTVTGTTSVKGKVQGGTAGAGAATATMPTAIGTINVDFGNKCNEAGTAAGTASPRSAAVLYNTETASGLAPQCVEA